jgi:hypothetical protein
VLGSITSYTYFRAFDTIEAEKTVAGFEYKGVNLVAPIRELRDSLVGELSQINVNAIALNPYAFVNLETGSVAYNTDRQWWGENTEGIRECTQKLHTAGFSLMLKPHLWINHQMYTGDLKFSSEAAWATFETGYEAYILDFARLAEQEGIEVFCIGTELGNAIATRPEYWARLISDIKEVYSGKLTYAANWNDYDKFPFWTSLDYIGIDAYFPLSASETPTIEELKNAWKVHILKMDELRSKYQKNILFTEFGYRNANRCAYEPWKEDNLVENKQAQVNAYEALFQSFSGKPWYKGGFAWKWYVDEYYKLEKTIDYTPQEKPALKIIKKWYE